MGREGAGESKKGPVSLYFWLKLKFKADNRTMTLYEQSEDENKFTLDCLVKVKPVNSRFRMSWPIIRKFIPMYDVFNTFSKAQLIP